MTPPVANKLVTSSDAKRKSSIIAEAGINTSSDFAKFMAAVMADLSSGRMKADEARALCTVGDSLLRLVELRFRLVGKKDGLVLGEQGGALAAPPDLRLTDGDK
jgi:hypothetical protein